tara:strand:- start:1155 stop:1991 length:837 start_codon:yes stop_codon:yes gene_type:complete
VRVIFWIYILFGSLSFAKESNGFDWIKSLPKPWELTEKDFSSFLPMFRERFPDFHDRIKALNLWRIGTPYGIFKLGEEKEPDTDPILRIDTSDCTVHVLTTLAFAQSTDWNSSRAAMIDIHYKVNQNGKKEPTFKSRWHYTSDRILNNPHTVNITPRLLSRSKLEEVTIELNRKKDGLEFLDLDWTSSQNILFIPSEMIEQINMQDLPLVCGIAFVKRSYFSMGIVIAHEGYLIDRKSLIHASSNEGKTVKVDFFDYYFKESGPVFDGIMIYELHKKI